jgi:hypothetical protein
MLFCEDCRQKKNWPDSIMESGKCEVCNRTQMCYDVPAVMLVPESERTVEQQQIYEMVQQGFKQKADSIVFTKLDGRVDNLMTKIAKGIFVKRGKTNSIDWYSTFNARRKAQESHLELERVKRDRRS